MPEVITVAEAGRRGGNARAAALTAEERREIAGRAGKVGGRRLWDNLTPEERAEHSRKVREGIERARRLREAADAGCPEHGRADLMVDGDLCLAEGCDWMAEDGDAA
jgi:hypothetical protein